MKRHSSKKSDLQSLLRNRNVLYVVLFFSVMNLFSYLMLKQLDAVAFFIIVGFLTTYFSKNMIIVLLTSVVSTFFLVQINLLGGNTREGLTGVGASEAGASEAGAGEAGTGTGTGAGTGASEADTDTDAGADTDTGAGASESEAAKANLGLEKPEITSDIPISDNLRQKITSIKDEKGVSGAGTSAASKKSTGKSASTERFTQQLNPARYNANDDSDDISPRHKPKIDYAGTLESAYDNLDKLLSSDAIRNMSEDTGRLAEKQKKLMDNIGKLTPIMDKASSVLANLDMGGISGLMGGIQNRLKSFGKSAAASTEPTEKE